MIEITMQLSGNKLIPLSIDDSEKLSNYKDNQIVKCKITGIDKPRSYLQLKRFFAICKIVSGNTDDENWNTVDKVLEQVKIKLQFIDSYIVVNGSVHIKTKSISFKELKHMEACNFFAHADNIFAKFLGCSLEELNEAEKNQ